MWAVNLPDLSLACIPVRGGKGRFFAPMHAAFIVVAGVQLAQGLHHRNGPVFCKVQRATLLVDRGINLQLTQAATLPLMKRAFRELVTKGANFQNFFLLQCLSSA